MRNLTLCIVFMMSVNTISSQSVGIGTNTPGTIINNSMLDVVGGHIAIQNDFGVLSYNSTHTRIGAGFDTDVNDGLSLFSGGVERIKLIGNGEVQILSDNGAMIKVNSGKMQFINPGANVFIGEKAGLSDILVFSGNVGIGYEALKNNVDGIGNVGLGYNALTQNTSGNFHVAIGLGALQVNTTGTNNTAIGTASMYYIPQHRFWGPCT